VVAPASPLSITDGQREVLETLVRRLTIRLRNTSPDEQYVGIGTFAAITSEGAQFDSRFEDLATAGMANGQFCRINHTASDIPYTTLQPDEEVAFGVAYNVRPGVRLDEVIFRARGSWNSSHIRLG
jgi:hypothetical protein